MSLPYTKQVIENFTNPQNVGEIENADAVATEGSPACGDMIKYSIKVNPETKLIEDIKFKSYGCASNIATASVATKLVKGKTIEEAKKINWSDVEVELGGLPTVKKHCAVLAMDAIKSVIDNYEQKNGLIKDKVPTDRAVIIQKLKHVIDPNSGENVIEMDLIGDIVVKDGDVGIELLLDKDNQFYGNIKEEIEEKIGVLWDVKSLEVH